LKAALEELQHLKSNAMEQETIVQQSLVDQSSKIAELEEIIHQYELDREAAEVNPPPSNF
jgi:hypothetical protein